MVHTITVAIIAVVTRISIDRIEIPSARRRPGDGKYGRGRE
jgi:hypothetical protein